MSRKMEILCAYKIDHDLGINPNPFGEYCTLAFCKGGMRDSIQKYAAKQRKQEVDSSVRDVRDLGIWVIGVSGRNMGEKYWGKLIYTMQVTDILTFEDYWADPRFRYKERDGIIDWEMKHRAFFRNNKDWKRRGDNNKPEKDWRWKDGKRDESAPPHNYVLVSDTFIYHGQECEKQDQCFIIDRLGYNQSHPIRPYLIFSDSRNNPIPDAVKDYIHNDFQNLKCLSRPIYSAPDFDYAVKEVLV